MNMILALFIKNMAISAFRCSSMITLGSQFAQTPTLFPVWQTASAWAQSTSEELVSVKSL